MLQENEFFVQRDANRTCSPGPFHSATNNREARGHQETKIVAINVLVKRVQKSVEQALSSQLTTCEFECRHRSSACCMRDNEERTGHRDVQPSVVYPKGEQEAQ